MTHFSIALSRARRSLGGHLARLRHSFDSLADQVREATARAVGLTVAEAVSEAIRAALAEPAFLPALPWDSPSRSGNDPGGRLWFVRHHQSALLNQNRTTNGALGRPSASVFGQADGSGKSGSQS
jgi:hypothetical protein